MLLIVGVVLFGDLPASASGAGDLLTSYLERYQRLGRRDIEGRMELADWCRFNGLYQQQADLLTEVLDLQPGHIVAYRSLLEADAKRFRPVDPQWARKLKDLLGPGFQLHHRPHFTILSDAGQEAMQVQADAMEETYRTFYEQTAAIGLRPMPPPGRLVCILFRNHSDYLDYLRRYEAVNANWTAGLYSWRTNRAAFYHDYDNPTFKDVRAKIAELEQKITDLRAEMNQSTANARKIQIQESLRRLNAIHADISGRLSIAAKQATLFKTRHEATHQLLYNSGIQRRDREYPFWLSEGLATNFETCDADGHAGPKFINIYRLKSYRQMKESRPPNLLHLLNVRPRDQEDPAWVAGRYAQAWALANFLWNRRSVQLQSYLEALDAEGRPRDWIAFFQAHFGEDLQSLDEEFRRYVDSLPLPE